MTAPASPTATPPPPRGPVRIGVDDLETRFAYHPPRDDATRLAHEEVRAQCYALARHLVTLVPPGREASLAVTAVEEAMMWANAGIARHPDPELAGDVQGSPR